ncbi:mediator of RNA polymerase II transcription subunit 13 [Umbelopsis nana]
MEEALLLDWANVLNIPLENLTPTVSGDASLSSVILVQCGEEVMPYPSALVFAPTSTKLTPSSISGLEGLGSRNHGLIEEMSEKYCRWAWEERIAEIAIKKGAEEAFGTGALQSSSVDRKHDAQSKFGSSLQTLPTPTEFSVQGKHNGDTERSTIFHPYFTVDFWKFTNPTAHVTATVLNHASMPDPFGSPTLLQNAMAEQLSSNMLMTPKTSRTPKRSTGTYHSGALQPTLSQTWDMRQSNSKDFMAQLNSSVDLSQHPLGRKSEHDDDSYPSVSSYPYSAQPTQSDIKAEVLPFSGAALSASQAKPVTTTQEMSGLQITMNEPATTELPGGHFAAANSGMQMNLGNTESHPSSNFPSPHDHLGGGNVDLTFGMDNLGGYDQMVYGMSSRWEEGVGDLDNFDLDVTEEDFDFFESTPTTKSRPAAEAVSSAADPRQSNLTSSVANPVSSLPADALNAPMMPDLNMATQDIEKHENLDLDELLMATNGFLEEPLKGEMNLGQDIVASQEEGVSIKQEDIIDNGVMIEDDIIPDLKVDHSKPDSNSLDRQGDIQLVDEQDDSLLDSDVIMPPEFAPVPVAAGVNDAKYYNGGKFVYSPSRKRKKEGGTRRRSAYKPDYMPHIRKKIVDATFKSEPRNKYTNDQAKLESTIHAPLTTNFNNMDDVKIPTEGTLVSDSSDDSSSDSSSASSDTDMEDADDIVRATSRLDITSGIDRQYFKALNKVKLALLAWSGGDFNDKGFPLSNQKSLPVNEAIDYDVPFAEVITREPIYDRPTEDRHTADGHLAAVELLCQQAVLGGYPFVGNIAESSQRGGDFIGGESMQVTITRRRNLIQTITSTPSLSDEMDRLTLDFKNVLSNIFDINKTSELPEYTHLQMDQHSLPTTITIKGPLNVQQYYELSDTTQTQSKYGKYQVKKRKPIEPNLDTLRPPNVVVGRQDEWIEGSPQILSFWEKLRLEPYSTKKNVVYFALCPDGEGLEGMVINFFKDLSAVFEVCLLGTHHPGVAGDRKRGVVPIQLLDKIDNEDAAERRLRSYRHAAQRLGAAIGSMGLEGVYYVIYMINPFSHSSSLLDLSQCFQNLVVAFNTSALGTTFSDKTRPRLVMQLIPMEHILRPTAFGGYTKFGLKEIAFSVYSKCAMIVERAHQQSRAEDLQAVTELYAPAFVLAKPPPSSIQYSTKNAYNPFPSSLEHDVTMHVAYTFSLDNRWVIAVWIDARGEMIDFMVLQVNGHIREPDWHLNAIKEIWERTKHICGRAGFIWKFTIGKLGLMFGNELSDWITTINNVENVSIIAVDYDSPFRVSHDSEPPAAPDSSNTPSSSSGAPTPETFTPGATPSMNIGSVNSPTAARSTDIFEPESGESHGLLVNHRVAYSQRRQLVSHGMLFSQDMSTAEEWMLPLASAYLLQVPVKTAAPSREQFSLETQAVEVHLIHMQSSQTAASVLRDIIKQYHSLSYLNTASDSSNCIPLHFVLVDRLCRLLYTVAA